MEGAVVPPRPTAPDFKMEVVSGDDKGATCRLSWKV